MNFMIFIVFLILIFLLQIFLSRNKFTGLIIPGFTFLYSLLAVFGYVGYDNQSILNIILSCIMIFIVSNIPTMIFLGIYFACRNKNIKNSNLDKMNIKDL